MFKKYKKTISFIKLLLIIVVFSAFFFFEIRVEKHSLVNGVSLFKKGVSQGLNLFNTRQGNLVYLTENNGRIVNQWLVPVKKKIGVHYSVIDPEGNLYSINQVVEIMKHDWEGNLLWRRKLNAHHDLVILENGDILSFNLEWTRVNRAGRSLRAVVDNLAILDHKTGKIKKRMPIASNLLGLIPDKFFLDADVDKDNLSDFLHINNMELLPMDINGVANKGDLMVLSRDMNMFIVFDQNTFEVKWHWVVPELDRPHQINFLEDGNLLTFDNGFHRKNSRVVELDLRKKSLANVYDIKEEFYSKTQGGVQSLENNNILVTVAAEGRVFELTSSLKKVWELVNLERNKNNKPMPIYFAKRYSRDYFDSELIQ